MSNLILLKFVIGVYMTNLGDIRQKQPIYGKIGSFRSYLDYIGSIQVDPIGPSNYLGYPWVQSDTYKVHYRVLDDQLRRYRSKMTYLGQNRAF